MYISSFLCVNVTGPGTHRRRCLNAGEGIMKNWVTAIAAATLTSVVGIQAHSADYADELREWVIGPCTEVSAALDVGDLDKDSLDLGIKRTDIAQLMVASRDSAVQDLAGKMKAVATALSR